jgi:flagellin-like hook-associated protein FlgL
MPINDITLSGGMRGSLVSLQLISALQSRTTERLSSGKRVNTPIDDPAAFFAAQNHRSRATDLAALKDSMGEALQTVKAASEGIETITTLIEQAKGLAASARSATTADRATLAGQFDDLLTQIDQLASDASYKGTNLLDADTLTVNFNPDGTSSIDIVGFDASSTGLSIATAAGSWATDANIDAAVDDLDTALGTLRTNGQTMGSNSGVVTARQSFTTELINTLTAGADNLTLADENEEGANMLALQTRQQLGIASLSIAAQSSQSILRLF